MVVAQAEINLVLNPAFKRRMMRMPVLPRVPCPVRLGHVYNLQPRPFSAGQVEITVVEIRREQLGEMPPLDAKREGYGSINGAVEAFKREHGGGIDQDVWAMRFARGDLSEFMSTDSAVYLSRFADFTTIAGKQAVRGDPELCMPDPTAVETARVMALANRTLPAVRQIAAVEEEVGALRRAMTSMKGRNRAKLIERELAKLRLELPVQEYVRSPMAV